MKFFPNINILRFDFRWKSLFILNSFYLTEIKFIVISCIFLSQQAIAQISFENATLEAGGPFHIGESWGASWGNMDGDVFPDLYSSNHAMPTSLLRNNGDGSFTNQIASRDLEGILTTESLADTHGGTWADFDNDGDQDLFVTRSSNGGRFYLFENDGQGFFEEKSGPYGIGDYGSGRMPVLFDYNMDGRLDVVLARSGQGSEIFKWDVTNFIEQTSVTGLSGQCDAAYSGFASDLFNQGSLNFLCLDETSIPLAAYDTTTTPFLDISSSIDRIGSNSDAVLADFNNDLQIDLFALRGRLRPSGVKQISNQRIEAWISVGGVTDFFKTVKSSTSSAITLTVYGRSIAEPELVYIGAAGNSPVQLPVTLDPADPDNWGMAEDYLRYGIFVEFDEITNEWAITMSTGGNANVGEGASIVIDGVDLSTPTITNLKPVDLPQDPRFLINNGSRLVDSGSRGIGAVMCGGIAAADFDNDMDIDLFLTCRSSFENLENRLYLNDGTGSFTLDQSSNGIAGLLGAGLNSGVGTAEMAITADYDVDGFMDLYVTNGNRLIPHLIKDGFTAGGPDQLYRNLGGNGNHWLEIDLQGVTVNRDGYGTKVTVTAGDVSQLREQNGQYHRWAHDHKRLHFGLGANTTADIKIDWPDGTTDTHTAVAVDRLYRAIQNESLVNTTPDTTLPMISINSITIQEGGDASLTVSLSDDSDQEIIVNFKTIAATAIVNDDYLPKSGVLIFAPGETSKTVLIKTVASSQTEPDEQFYVALFESNGSKITQSTGIVTIEEVGGLACDEPEYSTQEDKGLFVWRDCGGTNRWFFRATAGGGETTNYQGTVSSSDSIAVLSPSSLEGSDFINLSDNDRQLNFGLSMSLGGEDGFEFSHSVASDLCLIVSDPSQVIYVGSEKVPFTELVNLATVTDSCAPGLPTLSVEDVSVSESIGDAKVLMTLNEPSAVPISVSYTTQNGTALSGSDYEARSGIINFLPLETSKLITVAILQDLIIEPNEELMIILRDVDGAEILRTRAKIVIKDDDDLSEHKEVIVPIYYLLLEDVESSLGN